MHVIPLRLLLGIVLGLSSVTASFVFITDPIQARAVAVASLCLVLWLTEAVPTFVPTLLLLALVPLTLTGDNYRLSNVMGWMAEPVLLLFLGGFSLGVAAQRYGIDAAITSLAVRWSGGRRLRLLALVMISTATLSMWMSNTAAAAMMLAALRPMLANTDQDDRFRIALLLGIAIAANLGGLGTPIGSPPNAIAVAALANEHPVTLLSWMMFGIPCLVILLIVGFFVIVVLNRIKSGDQQQTQPTVAVSIHGWKAWSVVILFMSMVIAWMSEPLHGISVSLVAVCGTVILFASGLLAKTDLRSIDWGTLLLIAGGLGMGRLLQESGAIQALATGIDWSAMPSMLRLAVLIFLGAAMSAVMSNTATATMIIPLAYAIDHNPSTPILVALGTSMGMLFMISTPPNALVYGEGGMRMKDLFFPGIIMMVLGCLLLSFVGPLVFG